MTTPVHSIRKSKIDALYSLHELCRTILFQKIVKIMRDNDFKDDEILELIRDFGLR